MVEARDGATIVRKEYSLSGLTLTVPIVLSSNIFDPQDCTNKSGFYDGDGGGAVSAITQTLTEFSDDTELSAGTYSGVISGTTNGRKIFMGIKESFVNYLNQLAPADGSLGKVRIKNEWYNSDNQKVGEISGEFSPNGTYGDRIYDFATQFNATTTEIKLTITANYSDYSTVVFTTTYAIGGIIWS